MTTEEPQLEIRYDESTEVDEFLSNELSADSLAKGFEYKPSRFQIVIRERHRLVAALTAEINWQWIYIKKLAVIASRQNRGLGSKLIDTTVKIAQENQYRGIWVDTFSFQSPDFYAGHGFTEVGRIGDYPPGHHRIILQMPLLKVSEGEII